MKVCDIVQSYSPRSGGVKRYIKNKIRYFSAHPGIDHVLIVPGQTNRVRKQGRTRIYQVRSPFIPGSVDYRLLMDATRIRDIVAHENPAIIETDSVYVSAWIALNAACQQKVPLLAFYHSDFPRRLSHKLYPYCPPGGALLSRILRRYLRGFYNRAHATIVAAQPFERLLRGMGIPNIVKIPLGVNTEAFYPRAAKDRIRGELGLSQKTFLLLFAGRLARMKHIQSLIAMMDHLDGQGDFHLLIIGDGEEQEHVEPAAEQRADISWLPYIKDRNRLAEFYSAADLFVHAGTMETFGLVSVEARACGTRVLGVEGGGLELSLKGESPLIMAPDPAPQSLARAVLEVQALAETDADKRARSQEVRRTFSWDGTFRRLVSLYEHLIAGRRADWFE